MTSQLQNLITALRDELQQYGEMLALLEQQQEADNLRAADDLLLSISIVNAQSLKIQHARQHRQTQLTELAAALDCSATGSFATLVPQIPEEYRPLLSALVQENNELLVRVRQRARQNQILFRRSMETLQRFLDALNGGEQETHPIPEPSLQMPVLDDSLCGAVT